MFRHAYAGPPLGRRPDRSRRKSAAAVRAHIMQFRLDAIRAERAFVGADPRFRRIRRAGSLSQYSQFGRSCSAMGVPPVGAGRSSQIGTPFRNAGFPRFRPCAAENYRANTSPAGSLALSFRRSSTIERRTSATLWCGISTSLTISEQALEIAQHRLQQIIGVAGQRIGLLDIVNAVDQRADRLALSASGSPA